MSEPPDLHRRHADELPDLHRRHADELAELQAECDRLGRALRRAMAELERLREEAAVRTGGGDAP